MSFSSMSQALERTATNRVPRETRTGAVTAAIGAPTRSAHAGMTPAASTRSARPDRSRN